MPVVHLARHLYRFFPALEGRQLRVQAATAAEVVRALEALQPGFAFYICDELGRLRRHVNMFVGDEHIHDRTALSDAMPPEAEVYIMQSLSGG
ncbi:MAG: MoaD/ThiS family protein [Planctomycetes bacterium]|nr:MoaD/ThiS family protein [Planctomycetota bacterium]